MFGVGVSRNLCYHSIKAQHTEVLGTSKDVVVQDQQPEWVDAM